MPTVLHVHGFRIQVIKGDHVPAHVHVRKGRARARFFLEPVSLDWAKNMGRSELSRLEWFISQHQLELLEAWRSRHE